MRLIQLQVRSSLTLWKTKRNNERFGYRYIDFHPIHIFIRDVGMGDTKEKGEVAKMAVSEKIYIKKILKFGLTTLRGSVEQLNNYINETY